MPKLPEGVIVAAIAAASAVAGTLAGSIVTYEGNKTLQNKQVEQEARRQQAVSRALVRLLMAEYKADGDQLSDMLTKGAYNPSDYTERTFVSKVGEEDRKLLAGNLDENEWTKISETADDIEAVAADIESHRGQGRLDAESVELFEATEKKCEEAYVAVTPFAAGKAA